MTGQNIRYSRVNCALGPSKSITYIYILAFFSKRWDRVLNARLNLYCVSQHGPTLCSNQFVNGKGKMLGKGLY